MMKRIIFATGNENKMKEIRMILGDLGVEILSMKEAAFFGLAMSIDSLTAGTFAAFLHLPAGFTLAVCFLFGLAALAGGQCLGRRLASRSRRDFSWAGGLLFLALAFGRLLK